MKESVWTSEVDFKSECLADSQDIKGCFLFLEKHYLLSQSQLHLTGTILTNKLIMQMMETLNSSQLLFQRQELEGLGTAPPSSSHCFEVNLQSLVQAAGTPCGAGSTVMRRKAPVCPRGGGGPVTVAELCFLSEVINFTLNKRLLTVERGVIHHPDLYFALSLSCPCASGNVLKQTGLLGNGSHPEREGVSPSLPGQKPSPLQLTLAGGNPRASKTVSSFSTVPWTTRLSLEGPDLGRISRTGFMNPESCGQREG